MTTYTCNSPTLDGTPCSNPVAYGSSHCAAGHGIPLSRWTETPNTDTSNNKAALSGSLDFDEVLGSSRQGWERQADGFEDLLNAGFNPEDLIRTVTLNVEVSDKDGNTEVHEIDCYATGEDSDINLGHGSLESGKEEWHIIIPCDEPGCNQNAYVSLLGTVPSGDGASGALAIAIEKYDARSRRAFCPEHRYVHSN